jgi:hypothetical protein
MQLLYMKLLALPEMTRPDTERHRLYSSYGNHFLVRVLAFGLLMRMLIPH